MEQTAMIQLSMINFVWIMVSGLSLSVALVRKWKTFFEEVNAEYLNDICVTCGCFYLLGLVSCGCRWGRTHLWFWNFAVFRSYSWFEMATWFTFSSLCKQETNMRLVSSCFDVNLISTLHVYQIEHYRLWLHITIPITKPSESNQPLHPPLKTLG